MSSANPANDAAAQQFADRAASGSPLDMLMQQFGQQEALEMLNLLMADIQAGINPRQIAREMSNKLDELSYGRAETIARTESLGSWREAAWENYRANSDVVSQWMWMCTPGAGTCVSCLEEDGTLYDNQEEVQDHPNGRCVAMPVTREYADILSEYGIDTSDLSWDPAPWEDRQTGEEWLLAQDEETQRAAFGSNAAFNAWLSGDVSLSDFVGIRHDEVWGDSIYQKSLRSMGKDARDYGAGSAADQAARGAAAKATAEREAAALAELHAGQATEAEAEIAVADEQAVAGSADLAATQRELEQSADQMHDELDAGNHFERADETKVRVSQELADALHGSPEWQQLVEALGAPDDASAASSLLERWALGSSSVNEQGRALYTALQMAARDEFGLTSALSFSDEEVALAQQFYGDIMPGLRAYERAMYDQTQAWFQERDITDVLLYRGQGWEPGMQPDGLSWDGAVHHETFELRPISSFSADGWQSYGFGGGDYVDFERYQMLSASRVSVEDIIATPQTGFGSKQEVEVVVLGNPLDTLSYTQHVVVNGDPFMRGDNIYRIFADASSAARAPQISQLDQELRDAQAVLQQAVHVVEVNAPMQEMANVREEAQARIAARLADDPVWRAYVAASGKTPEEVAEMFSGSFRGTLNVNERSGAGAGAMQAAAREEFGLTGARIGYLEGLPGAQALYAEDGAVLRAYLRATYDETQQYLRDKGVTEVTLYRGVGVDAAGKPFVSYSVSREWAAIYANPEDFTGRAAAEAHVVEVNVPAERILGLPQTGIGNQLEGEVVLLAESPVSTAGITEDQLRSAIDSGALQPFGSSMNPTYTADIDGQQYFIKELVPGYATTLETGNEVTADAMAKVVGLDQYTLNPQELQIGDTHYIVEKWEAGAVTIAEVDDAGAALRAAMPAEDMQAQLMFNYVTGDHDRHAGNYLITADGKLAVIDHALSFVWPLSSFVDWQFDELLRGILTNEQFVQGAGWANLARISDVPLSAAAVERIVSRSDALLQIATAAGKDTAPLEERFAVLQRFLDEGGTTLQDLLRFSQEVE